MTVEDEDVLLFRLSSELIPNPELQAHDDHNDIISFAIDHNIDLQMTPSGLFYQILEEGSGNQLDWGDKIAVQYKGYFLDEKLFDTSCRRGKPLEFYIGNMIDGWNEGLQLLKLGAKALFLVPSRLAYGEEGLMDDKERELVPPDKVLLFEVEVVKVLDRRE